jgi:hypothetical protein
MIVAAEILKPVIGFVVEQDPEPASTMIEVY